MFVKRDFLIFCVAAALAAGSTAECRAQGRSLSDLSFMAGCWKGKVGDNGTIEERYSPPTAGLMLGTSHSVSGGRTAFFEFIKVEESADGGIVMTPAPRGKPSVPFKMVSLEGKKAVFENLEHDFPQRIIYHLRDNGSLAARIEGAKPEQSQELVMEPVACGTTRDVARLPTPWSSPPIQPRSIQTTRGRSCS